MSWHDDKQRHLDNEQARAVKAQLTEARKKTARRMYEGGATMEAISRTARVGDSTLKRWIREGGWRRDDA